MLKSATQQKHHRYSKAEYIKKEILHSSELYLLRKFYYIFTEQAISIHQVFYSLAAMYYSSVVAAPKMFADCFKGVFGKGFGEVHGNLPCLYYFTFTCFL